MNIVIARLLRLYEAFNTINLPTVDVYVQSAPGTPNIKRGVKGLDYQVLIGGFPMQSGQTNNNGKIEVRLFPGLATTVKVLGSEYEVGLLGALHPIAEMRGVQQRLTLLGFHTGPLHGDNRRADTYENPDVDTERAVLIFQADNNLFPDAMFGPKSEKALKKLMKKSKAE